MMKIYSEDIRGNVRQIAEINCDVGQADISERYAAAVKCIREFCAGYNYTIPYYRYSNTELIGEAATWFDVGSHCEFFYVCPPVFDPFMS